MKRWLTLLFTLLTAMAFGHAPPPKLVVPAAHSRGLVTTAREPSGDLTTLKYDARGRQRVTNLTETSTQGLLYTNLLSYAYDQAGNLTNLIYPGGRKVSYAHDVQNRLTNVTDWASRKTGFSYDLAGQLREIVRPNGTRRVLDYDAAGQTTRIEERRSDGSLIALYTPEWDAGGRLLNQFSVPQPRPVVEPSRTATHDADNRIATFNGQSVTHDPDGNLTWGPLTEASAAVFAPREAELIPCLIDDNG